MGQSVTVFKTLSVRVRDKHASVLSQAAFEVNQYWNAANEESSQLGWIPIPGVGWINGQTSAFDLQASLRDLRKERGFGIHSGTAQEVIAEHARKRRQFRRDKLRWRVSSGARRSLGWVPFKAGAAQWKRGQIYYNGTYFKVWDSYGLSQYRFKAGCFSEDARGRWYFNVIVEVHVRPVAGVSAIGIDLGIKATAACSDGVKFEKKGRYAALEAKLGLAQRAHKTDRARAIHAKIRNQRKNDVHQFTTALVRRHAAIFVGNVNSQFLIAGQPKAAYDAAHGLLRDQLKYKAIEHSVIYEEIGEQYTTQACSCCGQIGPNSPKGRAGLGIREWTCHACGATHDRDVNAAKNILALGHERLAGGIPGL